MGDKTQVRRTRPASKTPKSAEIASFSPLLRALAGRSHRDFVARVAVLQGLAESQRPVFSSRDLDNALPWLTGRARSAVLRALRQGGWLEADPATGRLVLTETGRQAYEALAFLHGGRPASSLTVEEVIVTLQGKSLRELASAGREALLPALLPLLLPSTDAIAQAAEAHILRHRTRDLQSRDQF